MKKITTIKLSTETKGRLDKLKEYERESYEFILRKILYILNTSRKDPEKAADILESIDKKITRRRRYTNHDSVQNKRVKELTLPKKVNEKTDETE